MEEKNYSFSDAFKALNLLCEEETFNLGDEDDVAALSDFKEKDDALADIEMIVDADAETEEDLKDSYVGSLIVQCPVCKTLIYKTEEEVEHEDEEHPELVNISNGCPHCGIDDEEFTIIGKVAPYKEDEPEEEVEDELEDESEETDAEDEISDEELLDDEEVVDEEEVNRELDELEGNKEVDESLIEAKSNVKLLKKPIEISRKNDITEGFKQRPIMRVVNSKKPHTSQISHKPVENVVEEQVESDFDEVKFNSLVEKYLHTIYENVNSFTTTNGSIDKDKKHLVIEGKIKFNSGKEKDTKFVFESIGESKKGKTIFVGLNETFTNSKKAFKLQGLVDNNKFISESFTYNYTTKLNNETKRVYGRTVNTK